MRGLCSDRIAETLWESRWGPRRWLWVPLNRREAIRLYPEPYPCAREKPVVKQDHSQVPEQRGEPLLRVGVLIKCNGPRSSCLPPLPDMSSGPGKILNLSELQC